MKDIFLLIKIFLINGLRPDKSKNKKGGLIAIYISLAICYLFIISGGITLIATIAPLINSAGFMAELITLIYIIGISMVVIFGIISLLTYVYFNKDAEFTATLPIKPGKVFLAKLSIVYIYELAAFAAIVVPLLITAGIATHQGVIFYLSILLGFFLAPAFPLAVASILAIPLMYVVSFFKSKGAFTTLFMMLLYGAFFGVYFYGVFKFQSAAQNVGDNIDYILPVFSTTLQTVSKIFYPIFAIACLATGKAIYGLNVPLSGLVNFVIAVGSLAALLLIAYFISNAVYQQSTIRQNESAKTTGKAEKTEERSAFKAIFIKEFRDIIRTPAFGFQCLAGMIILPILLIFMGFNGGFYTQGVSEEEFAKALASINPAIGFGFLMMLGSGMNITSSTAISREGKTFYLSKTFPVDYTTQIKAKLYLSLVINLITVLIGYVISIFIYNLDAIEIVFFPIVLALYSYGYALSTLRFDLKEPKLNWTTPNEAVKNNKKATIPTLINMAVSFVVMMLLIFLYIILGQAGIYLKYYWIVLIKIGVWIVITGAVVAFVAIARIRLYGSVNHLYENIEP